MRCVCAWQFVWFSIIKDYSYAQHRLYKASTETMNRYTDLNKRITNKNTTMSKQSQNQNMKS